MAQYSTEDIYKYIDAYKEIAIDKMAKFGIPASITLAQGIFESACGTSRLAVDANNHFGIKCHNWQGDTVLIDDDELNECFRKYEKVEDSYYDHSQFLITRSRYKSLFSLSSTDYVGWARGLKAAGYATNPKYAERLIALIETYHIARQDTVCLQRMGKIPADILPTENSRSVAEKSAETEQVKKDLPPASEGVVAATERSVETESGKREFSLPVNVQMNNVTSADLATTCRNSIVFTAKTVDFPQSDCPWSNRSVYENNRTQFVIAAVGDTYQSIAFDVQRSEKELLSYNEAFSNSKLVPGQVVYIEPKTRKLMKSHIVQKGENLRFISQKYAIQLKMLYHYNNLNEQSIIQPGDVIKMCN